MTPPIREVYFTVTAFDRPKEEYTLRQALEWYKNTIRVIASQQLVTTALETKYLNEQWVVLVTAIADREGVPPGSLSYYLHGIAEAEYAALAAAELEYEQATGATE